MCGNASGSSIFIHLCNRVTPDMDPASCKAEGTLLSPSIVYLVAGIVAYTTTAIRTDVSVTPNNIITGIK